MSRPNTRGKNKRHKQGDNVDATSEILRYMCSDISLAAALSTCFYWVIDLAFGRSVGKSTQLVL